MSAAAEYYGYLLSQGYGEDQLEKFADIADRADRGEISLNQSYKLACEEGFNNANEEEATEGGEKKGGFKDWINTAKEAGWLDKIINIGGSIVSNQQNQNLGGAGYTNQPTVIVQDDNKKSNKGLYIGLGVLALVGIGAAIYFANKKK
jgi:hypothetical protein